MDIRQLDLGEGYDKEENHFLQDPDVVAKSLDRFMSDRGYETVKKQSKLKKRKKQKWTNLSLELLKSLRLKEDRLVDEENLLRDLNLLYPLYGLKDALKRMHKGDSVSELDFKILAAFVDAFTTVSLHPAIVGNIVAAIAKEVNQHKHTRTCRKYNTVCRFKFPKLPFYCTVIARPAATTMPDKEKKNLEERHSRTLKKVQDVLTEKEKMLTILQDFPKDEELTEEQAREGRRRRIDAVLELAGVDKEQYKEMVTYSSAGFHVVMERDVDECNVNSYNPEVTRAWGGNTDFQICLDFFAIVTYITGGSQQIVTICPTCRLWNMSSTS